MRKKNQSNDPEKKWISFFRYLLRIEFKTEAGKINYRFGILLFIISFFLLVKDSIVEIINALIESFAPNPSSILNENISLVLLLIFIFLFFVFCILVISMSDRLINRMNKEIENIE